MVNEFGDINSASQRLHTTDDAVLVLSTGGICCTVHQDLIGAVGCIHAVHMTRARTQEAAWQPGEQQQSQTVFTGRNLQGDAVRHESENRFASSMATLLP